MFASVTAPQLEVVVITFAKLKSITRFPIETRLELIAPATYSFAVGAVVPIPTLPVEATPLIPSAVA